MKEQQGVQAREDPGHTVPVKLQLLQHAFPEHLRHDRQGLDVVQLRLHQLYKRVVIMGTEINVHASLVEIDQHGQWDYSGNLMFE